jgi:hypothetical protein
MLQYSSFVTQVFWAPNHAAPGWWIAVLILLRCRGEIGLPLLLACCAPLMIWSPLVVLGGVPLVTYVALRRPRYERVIIEAGILMTNSILFMPIAAYLLLGSTTIAKAWNLSNSSFVWTYLAFLLIELPQVMILLYAWRKIETSDRGALKAATITLAVLPIFSFGPSNDLALRASIPSLFLVAFSFARIAVLTPRFDPTFPIIALIELISSSIPAAQIGQAFLLKAYAISDCNLLTATQSVPTNYLVSQKTVPSWLLRLNPAMQPFLVERRDCWPDHPFRASLKEGGPR